MTTEINLDPIRAIADRVEIVGDAILIQADCAAVLPLLPKVDAVVTDPPYKFEKSIRRNEARGAAKGNSSYNELFSLGLHHGFQVSDLPFCANNFVFCAKNQLPELLKFIWGIDDQRWMLICWHKTKHQYLTGSYLPDTEYLLHWWKPNGLFGNKPPRFYFGEGGRESEHPTEKPVWLMTEILKSAGDTILDPFMGSGTTGVAAVQMGRKFIGIEREARYFEIAVKRIFEASNQGNLFIDITPPEKPVQEAML